MKKNILSTLFVALLSALPACGQVSFGNATLFNDGWLFTQEADNIDAFPQVSHWRSVTLPHDYSIEGTMSEQLYSCTGYLPGGKGCYVKHFSLAPRDKDLSLFVYFEGIYNRSRIYLNGHLIGERPNGYVSTLYALPAEWLNATDNSLVVFTDHSREADSRWYTGSGIYRNAWLIRAPKTHLALWGTAYRLQQLSGAEARVEVDVETAGEPLQEGLTCMVEWCLSDGTVVATAASPIAAPAKTTLTLTVPQPKTWSLEHPYLYRLRTTLLHNGIAVDSSSVAAGLRTLSFDADHGFALNGKPMKVKGVCLHHDAGVLGAAVPPVVWKYRLRQLKAIGVNAIRCSHNPQAPLLYDLCDTLGLLVMDEASDEWEFPKRKWLKGWNQGKPGYEGSYDFFEEWIDRDVADMVRRDRCHPSVFLWSIGNEVDYPNDPYSHPVLDGSSITQPMYGGYKPDQPRAERIGAIAERLSRVVRSIDTSRPVTGALAGVVMSNETTYPQAVDVVGYNYTESRYQEDHERYPQRIIYGSENRHDMPAWKAVRDNEHIFGQFLWTGADYLGESGRWPARGSEAGLLDLASQRKPRGWFRAALWSDEPVCYVGAYPIRQPRNRQRRGMGNWVSQDAPPLWNYQPGQQVRVVCYTNQPTARLLLNDSLVGQPQQRNDSTGCIYWDIPYAEGTLRAEALDATGSVKAVYTLQSAGEACAVETQVLADEQGVAIVQATIVDREGRRVTMANNELTCRVTNGRLLGLENGDNRDTTSASSAVRRAKFGRLIAYVAWEQGATTPPQVEFQLGAAAPPMPWR